MSIKIKQNNEHSATVEELRRVKPVTKVHVAKDRNTRAKKVGSHRPGR